MAKINLNNIIWKEGNNYVSWNLDTGVSSFGSTKKEAFDSLREALELYFEDTPVAKINKVENLALVPMAFEYA